MTAARTPSSSPESTSVTRSRFLQKLDEDTGLLTLGSSVSRVVQLTSSDDEAVNNLTNFVLSDIALTQKILHLANTAYYRTAFGTPVNTVSRAILLLGFDTIKACALAMLLVDRLSDCKHAQSVRAELSQALCASVIGREVARHSPFQGGEEAAIVALFKNLGRVLLASYDFTLYTKIVSLINSGSHTIGQAAMEVLGCSLDMLAGHVLQKWQMPDTLVRALVPVVGSVVRPPKNRQEWIQQVACFSAETAKMTPPLDGAANAAAHQALLARFGSALNLDQGKLEQLFATVGPEIGILMQALGLAPETVGLVEGVAGADMHGLPDDLLFDRFDTQSLSPGPCHPSGKPMNARELLLNGVQDVTQMMSSGQYKANELILLVLETLYSSIGFRFATVCLKDMKSNQYRARIAIGENQQARQAGFVFPGAPVRDLFHLALENDADLMISDATTPKIQSLIPAWHRALLPDAHSFIVLPLVVQKKPIGLFYADRSQLAPEGMSSEETSLVKTLKGQVLAVLNAR
jgi:HD-like signal output (HDOD) protein